MSSSSSKRPRCLPDAERDLEEDELEEATFLEEEEDLPESDALVPEKEAEMERLAARDSSSGAREEDEEDVRDGMIVGFYRSGRVEPYTNVWVRSTGSMRNGHASGRLSAQWRKARRANASVVG